MLKFRNLPNLIFIFDLFRKKPFVSTDDGSGNKNQPNNFVTKSVVEERAKLATLATKNGYAPT